MRDVVTRWRRYWFAPAPLLNLGMARIIVCAILLGLDPRHRFLRIGVVAPEFWTPIGLLRVLGIPQPSVAELALLGNASFVLLCLVALGIGTHVALACLLPLQLLQEAMLNSMGKTSHGTIPLLYALLVLLLAPCDRAVSVAAVWRRWRGTGRVRRESMSPYARWPLEVIFIELAAFYAFAGMAKLRTSGVAWMDGYTLQYWLLYMGTPWGTWMASHLWLCAAFSVATVVFELGFPIGIVIQRLRPVLLIGGALFHLGTTYFMKISFWPVVALYLVFVPWDRLAARGPTGGAIGAPRDGAGEGRGGASSTSA